MRYTSFHKQAKGVVNASAVKMQTAKAIERLTWGASRSIGRSAYRLLSEALTSLLASSRKRIFAFAVFLFFVLAAIALTVIDCGLPGSEKNENSMPARVLKFNPLSILPVSEKYAVFNKISDKTPNALHNAHELFSFLAVDPLSRHAFALNIISHGLAFELFIALISMLYG